MKAAHMQFVLIALLLVAFPGPALAQDTPSEEPPEEALAQPSPDPKGPHRAYGHIGIGAIGGRIKYDGGPQEDLGEGVHLVMGLDRGHFSFEFNYGNPSPEDSFLGIGLKLNILPYNEYQATPWVGLDMLVLDVFTNQDRGCFAPTLGVDIRLTRGVALRLGATECSYTEDLSWPWAGQSVKKEMTYFMVDLIFFGG
jgi:hypothetical protein